MAVKIYPFRIEPEKYAAFSKRPFPVVTRQALDNRVQFSSLRSFPEEADESILLGDVGAHPPLKDGGRLAYIEETVDMYVHHFRLGKVLWPVYPTLFAENFNDMVDLCVREGLYLYDFWGYVPGSRPSDQSIWGEYMIPEKVDRYMQEKLGDHFLGYDNGEQDGRYIGYARRHLPNTGCRKAEYERFQAYFQKLGDAMRNHTVTLASLTFLPYFAKEGNTIMIGAETAQALPGNNMWFSFIRGAAKQYGLLYYGNASIWNRWGYKDYANMNREPEIVWGHDEMGRFAGTSLSLLKRLIYNHYMYDCDILGFENGWFTMRKAEAGDVTNDRQYVVGNKCHVFTPVGDIQQKAAEFVQKHGRAGVTHTPVAMMLDFHAGWVPPRHLYVRDIYKVWGSQPYNTGDFQTHCLMSMLYPHYEDAGYFRSEQGFETATPYGEIMDVLLSDAAPEILARYPVLLVTCGVKLTRELEENLRIYVEKGGTLIAFAGNAAAVAELFGAKKLTANADGSYCAEAAGDAELNGLLLRRRLGKGETRLILHESGLMETGEALNSRNVENEPICQPYRLIKEVEDILAAAYGEVQLLKVTNPALQYVTSVRSEREYTFMVSSAAAQNERFDIVSAVGEIESIEELPTTDGVEALEEFLPLMHEEPGAPCCAEGEYEIQPGCVRIFRIMLKEAQVEMLPESNPAKREESRYLALPSFAHTLKRALLDLPTFSRHFDGFIVSARYLEDMDEEAVRRDAHYLNLQDMHLIVDFTDLINHYPDLSLIGNLPERDAEGMRRIEAILNKAALYRCDSVLICPQRNAENEYTPDQAKAGFVHSVERIEKMCMERGLTLKIRNRTEFISPLPATVFETASAQAAGECGLPENTELLLLSSACTDRFGQVYAMNRPLAGNTDERLTAWKNQAKARKLPIVLMADYANWDEIYEDLMWLDK